MSTFNVRVFNLVSEECVAKVRYPDGSKTVNVSRKECTDPITMYGNKSLEIWFETAPTKEVYLQYFLPNEKIGNGGSSSQGYVNIQVGISIPGKNKWKIKNRALVYNGAKQKQKAKKGNPTVNVTIGENETNTSAVIR